MTVVVKRGSRAAKVIETAWEGLRSLDARIPKAVIVLVDAGARHRKLGHFARSSWSAGRGSTHEVAISPRLFQWPKHVLGTLVHEAAHAILWKEDGGVSGAYYHTKKFRNVCRELELSCGFRNTRYGWTETGWPRGRVPGRYKAILNELSRGLPEGAEAPAPPPLRPGKLPRTGVVRLTCSCDPHRTIHVPYGSLLGAIRCGACRSDFD